MRLSHEHKLQPDCSRVFLYALKTVFKFCVCTTILSFANAIVANFPQVWYRGNNIAPKENPSGQKWWRWSDSNRHVLRTLDFESSTSANSITPPSVKSKNRSSEVGEILGRDVQPKARVNLSETLILQAASTQHGAVDFESSTSANSITLAWCPVGQRHIV